jgi:DNA polymerase V
MLPISADSSVSLALKAIYKPDYYYKKSGVIVTEIIPENQIQYDLLDTVDRDKHNRLMHVLDVLTDKFERSKVQVAVQGLSKEWILKSDLPPGIQPE